MKDKTEEYWRQKLTPEQYRVLRQAGTEPPFSGKYVETDAPGVYKCAACGQELFRSATKFHADPPNRGWPSFWEAVDPARIDLEDDYSAGMHRIEVKCANCGSHLGHLFTDGPTEHGGQHYCINSTALQLDPNPSEESGEAGSK